MLQIREFVRPETLEEAYGLLSANKTATLVGGGAYLRLGKKRIGTAIDIAALGLNTLEADGQSCLIGAGVTFGELERSPLLAEHGCGVFAQALRDVVGVQFRNTVTVGATVFSRYGFSDLLPPLLALKASVRLFHGGELPLSEFLELKNPGRDILTHVVIPAGCTAAVFRSQRLSTGDYAALNMTLAHAGGQWRLAVGARPGRAALATETMALLNASDWNETLMEQACETVARELTYGTNSRGSAEYRRLLAASLLRSAMKEVCAC